MNDCPNAEIRDELPDLLHERLDGARREVVLAHVAACVDCRAELELLRGVRGVLLSATPRVDVAAIVARIPAPIAATPTVRPLQRRWVSWQLAAAVTLLVAGGTSVLTLVERAPGGAASLATTESAAVAMPATTTMGIGPSTAGAPAPASVPETRPAAARPAHELALNGQLGDLDEGELRTLLADIDGIEAVPTLEPESLGLNPPALTPEEQR